MDVVISRHAAALLFDSSSAHHQNTKRSSEKFLNKCKMTLMTRCELWTQETNKTCLYSDTIML